jgi:hypothetical protein
VCKCVSGLFYWSCSMKLFSYFLLSVK